MTCLKASNQRMGGQCIPGIYKASYLAASSRHCVRGHGYRATPGLASAVSALDPGRVHWVSSSDTQVGLQLPRHILLGKDELPQPPSPSQLSLGWGISPILYVSGQGRHSCLFYPLTKARPARPAVSEFLWPGEASLPFLPPSPEGHAESASLSGGHCSSSRTGERHRGDSALGRES